MSTEYAIYITLYSGNSVHEFLGDYTELSVGEVDELHNLCERAASGELAHLTLYTSDGVKYFTSELLSKSILTVKKRPAKLRRPAKPEKEIVNY